MQSAYLQARALPRERAEDAKLRRWREKAFTRAFLLTAFGLCVVWAVVFLSGRFTPADKELATELVWKITYGLACFLAGKSVKSQV